MQQFGFDGTHSDPVHLTEEEARALAELHAKRREMQSQPNLRDLALQLGVSEAEAMSMLTEIRANRTPPVAPSSTPPAHCHVVAPERRISSQMWALYALGAAVVVMLGGFYSYRAYLATSAPPVTSISITAPAPVMPPPAIAEDVAIASEAPFVLDERSREELRAEIEAAREHAGTPAPGP
jgi:hypothetical protein